MKQLSVFNKGEKEVIAVVFGEWIMMVLKLKPVFLLNFLHIKKIKMLGWKRICEIKMKNESYLSRWTMSDMVLLIILREWEGGVDTGLK